MQEAQTRTHFVEVLTRNARKRTYWFSSQEDAEQWVQLFTKIDPQTAQTATIHKA